MIERLRALEKKFREDGRRAANGPMCDGASEYAVAGTYIACADELAALIAELGQEVGAEVFAWVREQPRGWGILTELDVSKPADPAEMLANGWFPVYRTSPAHTSEARDAARMNWLDTATTAGSVEMTFSHSDVLKLRGMGSVRQCCDAAMRQEGGE